MQMQEYPEYSYTRPSRPSNTYHQRAGYIDTRLTIDVSRTERRMQREYPVPVPPDEFELDQFSNASDIGNSCYEQYDSIAGAFRQITESGAISPSEYSPSDFGDVLDSRGGDVRRSRHYAKKHLSHEHAKNTLVQYSPTGNSADLRDYFVIGHETKKGIAGRQYLYTLFPAREGSGPEHKGVKEKDLKYRSRSSC